MTDAVNEELEKVPGPLDEVPAPEHVPEETPPPPEQLIIGEELTDEDRSKIYERLGRPVDSDGYDLEGIVPEKYNHDLVDQFKKKAHEVGMSNDATRKMAEWYKNVEVAQKQAIDQARKLQAEAWVLELHRDFGNRYDAEVANAKKALEAYTDRAFIDYVQSTGLGDHPALVKAFAKIGRELSEDRLVQSETATRLAADDELRRSEINRLWSDKEFAQKYRRGDPSAVARMNSLYGLGDK